MKKILAIIFTLIAVLSFTACNVGDNNKGGEKPVSASMSEKLQSLKGKVVYNIGQGNVPDLTFRAILKQNGIPYEIGSQAKEGVVCLSYVADGAAANVKLATSGISYVIVPEPAATVSLTKVSGSETFINVQEAYGGSYPQAAVVVKNAFLEQYPNYVAKFVSELNGAGEWLAQNLDSGKTALQSVGSTTLSALSINSVERSNVRFQSALDAKSYVEQYFDAIREVGENDNNPIGGEKPAQNFYATVPTFTQIEDVTAKIYAPDGAPALALAKIKAQNVIPAQINVVTATTIGREVKQNADIAIMPINGAATLYNSGTAISMLGVITHGNLYMLRG